MAIDKKKLLEMLSRPEQMSADEVDDQVPEESDEDESVENPEESHSVPSQIKAGIKKADDMSAPEDEHKIDESKLTEPEGIKSPLSDEDIAMKKKAISETLKKYLGR